jgi:ATPase family associated with various cellular activities (AAA)
VNQSPAWQAANDRHLAAALHWLRLRLGWHAAGRRAAVMVVGADEPTGPAPAAGTPPPATAVTEEQLAEAEAAMLRAEEVEPPPALVRLGHLLDLSAFERQVLLLCAAMELDPQMASYCAVAQGDPRLAYPTFALALSALPDPAWDALSPHGGLRGWRLIEISQPPGHPLVASALRADERVGNYLKGLNELDDRLEPLLTPVVAATTDLAPSQQEAVRAITLRWDQAGPGEPPPVAQLLGPDPRSKQLVAAEAAAQLGLRLLRLTAMMLPSQVGDVETLARLWSRERILLDCALYLDAQETGGEAEAGQAALLARFLTRTSGPVFLGVREPWPDLDRPSFPVDVDRPTQDEQRSAWTAVLGPGRPGIPELLAGQFNLNLPTIRQVTGAVADTAPADQEQVRERLWNACLALTRPRLDALAQRLEPKASWDQLVLPAAELAVLHQIADQVAQRSTVYGTWGFAERTNRGLGISALFSGPSGTGKTMAAEVIANELHLSLYRIDLSAVVSKYIGETEKNLRRLFDAAEEGAALLFFDEADALFGKRSEVKDSHDRYANIEINYLLQRMEAYRGLAVLATNMRGAMDAAFLRRLRFIVTFPFPGPAERRRIWEGVFPEKTPREGLDLDRLARLRITGGTIQGIAVNAAFAAAHAGRRPVSMPLVLEAARTEFRKLGLPVRDRDFQWPAPDPVRR